MSSGAVGVRRRVVYSGRVQGVGFRMTACGIARGFDVTGWVRNLMDGTVELEAQGTTIELDRFLAAISDHFRDQIRDQSTVELSASVTETGFRIRHAGS